MSNIFTRDNMGEDARDYVAKNCKEGVDPRSAIDDHGDYENDHNRIRDEHGTSYSTAEEVKEYYEAGRNDREYRIK